MKRTDQPHDLLEMLFDVVALLTAYQKPISQSLLYVLAYHVYRFSTKYTELENVYWSSIDALFSLCAPAKTKTYPFKVTEIY